MLHTSAPPPAYQYSTRTGPNTPVQPVFVTVASRANPVPDYMGYSIFTMLCCCFPLGIAALVYSCFTRDANYSGQQELAEMNSKKARTLNHIALGIGLSIITLVIISKTVA